MADDAERKIVVVGAAGLAGVAAEIAVSAGWDLIGGGGPSKTWLQSEACRKAARRERESWGEQPETRQQRRARERKEAKRRKDASHA